MGRGEAERGSEDREKECKGKMVKSRRGKYGEEKGGGGVDGE